MPKNRKYRRLISRGRWIAVPAVSVGLVGASAAMAVTVAKQPGTIPSQGVGSALAQCTGGRTAVAGGFAAPGFDPGGSATIARLSSTHAGKGGIKARGFNFGSASGNLVSYAYCARYDHGFQVSSASTQIDPMTTGSAVANCPTGTKAVGGGFDGGSVSQNGSTVLTLTSKRQGERRWEAVAVNLPPDSGSGTPATLTAYVYCEHAPFDLSTVSKKVSPPSNGVATFVVRCPDGGQAFSGGFDGHVKIGTELSATAAVSSKRASHGHAWSTTALSPFGSTPGTSTAYAYCRPAR